MEKDVMCKTCGHKMILHANKRNGTRCYKTESTGYLAREVKEGRTSLANEEGKIATCYHCRKNKMRCGVYSK